MVAGASPTPSNVEIHDYEPLGAELPPSTNQAYNTHQFTGHERDLATGYDNMHFRYYGSNLGRFMKPDNIPGNLANPQSWNLYSYVHGNPVNFNDPTGHLLADSRTFSIPGSGTAAATYEQFTNGAVGLGFDALGDAMYDSAMGMAGLHSWLDLPKPSPQKHDSMRAPTDEELLDHFLKVGEIIPKLKSLVVGVVVQLTSIPSEVLKLLPLPSLGGGEVQQGKAEGLARGGQVVSIIMTLFTIPTAPGKYWRAYEDQMNSNVSKPSIPGVPGERNQPNVPYRSAEHRSLYPGAIFFGPYGR